MYDKDLKNVILLVVKKTHKNNGLSTSIGKLFI